MLQAQLHACYSVAVLLQVSSQLQAQVQVKEGTLPSPQQPGPVLVHGPAQHITASEPVDIYM